MVVYLCSGVFFAFCLHLSVIFFSFCSVVSFYTSGHYNLLNVTSTVVCMERPSLICMKCKTLLPYFLVLSRTGAVHLCVNCRSNMSCDGRVEFPLDEKIRLVDMFVFCGFCSVN